MQYSVSLLPNGLYRIHDRMSGLSGLYSADGSYQSGDLRLTQSHASRVIF